MEETAYAKINLALHVRERTPDGYHRIETLFAFAADGDRLSVESSDTLTLTVTGPFANQLGPSSGNLVIRAAEALRNRFDVTAGASLHLDKSLPVASGIGGGSADAAAALRLLARWWELPASEGDLLDIAAGLGADVPACVGSRSCRGEGRGDILVSQDGSGLAGMPLLLVNPGIKLSTAEVFAAWDGVDGGALPIASPLATALEGRNDLEQAACAIVPDVTDVLSSFDGAVLSRMSGSGATCFALFGDLDERDTCARSIAAAQPGWWQLVTALR